MGGERLRRLPGIRIEHIPTQVADELPRMDVPVFVGFASDGAFDSPVAIEDAAGFTTEFGEDAVLARDAERGVEVRSYLGPCVRSFFANGGRRCWVIRVALPEGGWEKLGADAFLDPGLREVGVESLLVEADYLRYQAMPGRALRGIHAALAVDEATLIAVPDAVHVSTSLDPVAWPEVEPPEEEAEPTPEPGFHTCAAAPEAVPDLVVSRPLDDPRAIDLAWSPPAEPGEATEIDIRLGANDAIGEVIDAGRTRTLRLRGLEPGERWFRARYVRGGKPGSWSATVHVPILPLDLPTSVIETGYLAPTGIGAARMAGLLEIQRALLAMCAARGDLFAVLSLPGHLREHETIDYMSALRARPAAGGEGSPTTPSLPERAWSFGAVYHPWIVGLAAGPRADVILMPPDGAICGVFARRAIGRGAWVAPANETLNGIVALAPRMLRSWWETLQDAHVNVIRHEPRGFLAFSADTLSDDPDYRQISVRRLLILLRRYALARGMRHVFEPNSGAFRRRVQADFESMLGSLFSRGAFAGESPRSAFQVVTDDSINTAKAIDAGRFVVELRVAPSLPMRFLTVRLLHAADRALALAEA